MLLHDAIKYDTGSLVYVIYLRLVVALRNVFYIFQTQTTGKCVYIYEKCLYDSPTFYPCIRRLHHNENSEIRRYFQLKQLDTV